MNITNYEMESSALAGLASILGHKTACICMVVANRRQKEAFTNYKQSMNDLVQKVLERI
jgi:phosphorylase family protein